MLSTIRIVDCTFRCVPFPLLCMWNGRFTSVSVATVYGIRVKWHSLKFVSCRFISYPTLTDYGR